MDRQTIFTKVATHLLRQGERAMSGGKCRYRGINGTKCAIGILIPDEKYKPEMENVFLTIVIKLSGLDEQDNSFYGCLQDIHDNGNNYRLELARFAKYNGLEMPVVEEIKGTIR